MEDDEEMLSNVNNKPSLDEVNDSKVEEKMDSSVEIIKYEQCEVEHNLNGSNSAGAVVEKENMVAVALMEAVAETEVEGGEKFVGDTGDSHEAVAELKMEAEVAAEGGQEKPASDKRSAAVARMEESLVVEAVRDGGGKTVCDGADVQTVGAEPVIALGGDKEVVEKDMLGGGYKVVSKIGFTQLGIADSADDDQVVKGGKEISNVGVEKDDRIMVAEYVDMETESVVEAAIGKEENLARKLNGLHTVGADLEDAISNEKTDEVMAEVIPSAEARMETDTTAGENVMMDKGGEGEHVPKFNSSCVVGSERSTMAKDEKDEAKEVANEESLVGEAQMEDKQIDSEASYVVKEEKDEVEGLIEGKNLVAYNRLESEKGVDMDLEESKDTKLVDSQYNLAESLIAAKRSEDEEAEAKEEIGMEDTRMEDETETEVENMETIKDGDGEGLDELEGPKGPQDEEDEEMVAEEETTLVDTDAETETDVAEPGKAAGGKRKRGKISRSPANSKVAANAWKTIEEDVCFICFDGGELVLCDRRGCPKAYHPSCVDRDEAFFRAKGRWNCGWHLCSICEKNAHYMCCTCTFSLCKGCIKDAVILCVRGNKGFCETCMRTVMLIENNEQGKKDDQIDFDDKNSWEYLFKDYYIDLKSKLSLSLFELAEAKNPWKGSGAFAVKQDKVPTGIQQKASAGKQKSPEPQVDTKNNGGIAPYNSSEIVETGKSKRRKVKKQPKTPSKGEDSMDAAKVIGDEDNSTPGAIEWASKELLEFVRHMKHGDKSVLSQYDVQAILLEYIKRNNLRDPRQKSRIICDPRLQNLFGKPRVAHFEMLKLLESHFLMKENSQTDNVQGIVIDTEVDQLEADENAHTLTKGVKDRKRKTRKKGGKRGPQSNLDDYAAIDLHNISLIFLRRKLMEDLLEDMETFHDKVIGAFVRIRISGSVQKQDLYRLVQVVGTSKAAEPYKVGKRTTVIMLEILNLNKTEIMSMDTISNQDFTEDECKRLRQSIKCGLINTMTVGEFLDKAMELQTKRVTDWLESEIVRLSHLCDRASEKGHKKELRECVEKLQLLKTPEERQRRLEEFPEIHADPNMDPSYESEEDASKEVYTKTRGSGSRGGRGQISPGSDFFSKDAWSSGEKYPSNNWDLDRNLSSKNLLNKSEENAIHIGEVVSESSWNQGRDRSTQESSNMEKLDSATYSETVGWKNDTVSKSESFTTVSSITSPSPLSVRVAETAIKINESEKTWHYQDPSGKVQGPFSMVQLRKWSSTGYFPADLTIWRTTEKQDDCIHLTDALAGKFQELPVIDNRFASSTLRSPHTLSGNPAKNIEISLKKAREDQHGEKLKVEQNNEAGDSLSQKCSPREPTAPSVELPKISTERWSRSYPSNLPSPPQKSNSAGWTGVRDPRTNAISFSGGTLIKGSGNDSINSGIGSSAAPNSDQGVLLVSANSLQNSRSVVTSEPHAVQMQSHLVTGQHIVAPSVQPVNSQSTLAETVGWGSSPLQKVEANASNPVPGQPQAYGMWGVIPSNVQTHAGNIPNPGTISVPQSDLWRPTQGSLPNVHTTSVPQSELSRPTQGCQPNVQPPAITNTPWAIGMTENKAPAPVLRPENPNFAWGAMQGSPNMGWVAAAPVNANINLGTSIQGPSGATFQGQVSANANPGWVAAARNPAVQGLAPGSSNQSWVAPTSQGPVSGWAPPSGNVGATVQGPMPGYANQGWGAAARNQSTRGSEQNHTGGKFSGQRDNGSHGGDSGYGSGRSWNRQSSFGNGRPGGSSRHFPRGHIPCPYNNYGQCRKGAACDYLHT